MNTNLTESIKRIILNNGLFAPNDKVLVAVSGGADSVCLLHILYALKDELHLNLFVAHVNHMLRKKEADRDENFVRTLSLKLGLPFFAEKIDVKKISKDKKISLEEAGRIARYDFFNRIKNEHKIDKIATAHNKNDNAETVCMRFVRGTFLSGMAGIPLVNDAGVVRPLLFTERSEIETYLSQNNLSYITDSSNLSDDYTRNKIRHHFIPKILEEYNGNFINTISENALHFREADAFIKKETNFCFEKLAKREPFGLCFSVSELLKEDKFLIKCVIQKAILTLTGKSVLNKISNEILNSVLYGTVSSFTVGETLSVYKKYGTLFFVQNMSIQKFCYERKDEPFIEITETGHKIYFSEESVFPTKNDKNVIFVKKSLLNGGTFSFRNRKNGDVISLGKGRTKKLQDLFVDEKIPVFLRDSIPILTYNGEIVWVLGIRDNPKFRAKNGDEYIKIFYTKENSDE